MKVSVYKREDGDVDVLVQASVGKGRAPVFLGQVALGLLKPAVLKAVDVARGPKVPKNGRAP